MLCVKDCPQTEEEKLDCLPNTDVTSCNDVKTYQTFKFASRICIPRNHQMSNNVFVKMNVNIWEENIKDIKDSWPVLILLLVCTILLSCIFFYLIEYCASLMIFLMLIGSICALIIFGFYNWSQYNRVIEESVVKQDEAN